MFPAGAVGVALLILRIAVAGAVILQEVIKGRSTCPWWEVAAMSMIAGFLCIGLFSPVASALCACIEAYHLSALRGTAEIQSLFSVLIAVSVAILGPGALSVDAKLYGR